MAKEVSAQIKLQIPAGKANPAPPVGPSLGQHGVNIMEFCKQFNAKTQKEGDSIIPVMLSPSVWVLEARVVRVLRARGGSSDRRRGYRPRRR